MRCLRKRGILCPICHQNRAHFPLTFRNCKPWLDLPEEGEIVPKASPKIRGRAALFFIIKIGPTFPNIEKLQKLL